MKRIMFGYECEDKSGCDYMISAGFKEHYVFSFENGYGASVIRGEHSYGGPNGLYELIVLKDGELCDILPCLLPKDVESYLKDISNA